MAILGSILKKAIEIRGKRTPKAQTAFKQQAKVLRKLVKKAEFTAFGDHYHFSELLKEKNLIKAFRSTVPLHDYNSMFKNWWFRSLNGEPFVTWPNHIKYFALSSGTSESSSKHIPVTRDMLKAIRKVSVRQTLSLANMDLPKEHFEKGVLMIGGSTHLNYNGTYYEGDLSGITTGNIPFWFQHFYKPGPAISRHKDWESKLTDITLNASKWDIGVICGVPAWIQILFERIIKHYNVKTIHDVWPNLRIYVHGGVAISPYLNTLNKLTAQPLIYLDTYLASEGFMAYQNRINDLGAMKLVTDNGVFHEFIPFTDENFDEEGVLKPNANALTINQVEVDKEYALIISTVSGAWRYLIGDTIKFTDVENTEIIITGRTKHFLSLCGEHLSVDNMNKATKLVADELKLEINEYTVAPLNYAGLFAHQWYVSVNKEVDEQDIKQRIDNHLKILNDDYRVERSAALKDIFVKALPHHVFMDFMKSKGKVGSQHKFPRVLKGKMLEDWNNFLKDNNLV